MRDDRAAAQECGDSRGVEGRRHDHQPEIVSRLHGLPRERNAQVGVDAALVEFVEDDRAESRQEGVLLETRGENALRGNQQARRIGELALHAHVPADVPADDPALFHRDTPGDGPGPPIVVAAERSPAPHRAGLVECAWSCPRPGRRR